MEGKNGEFMKIRNLQKMAAAVAVAGLALTAFAQDFSGANTAQPAAVNANVMQLPYGVPQVVQLAQARISDDTIIAYIKNSGNSYTLDANQILYLRRQGVSDAVISTMLSQPKPATDVTPQLATPAPQPVTTTAIAAPVATTTVVPTVTYVQTAPAPAYYYQPYYYPTYGVSPALSLSFAWGSSWHGGGYYGGWHGGGWHH
jgi:hypothetical protein